MPGQLVALLTVLLISACSGAREPAGLPDLEPILEPPNDQVIEVIEEIERSRWVGIGSYDACGLSWAIDLVQDGDRVSGYLLWETVRYDLSGTIAPDGSLQKARAGKSPDFNGVPAPRFVIVSLEFGARKAVGYYAAETQGSSDCATAVELDRYAAE